MSWTWSWWVFGGVLFPMFFFVLFARGGMNERNVAKHGLRADYNFALATERGPFLIGNFVAAAIWSAVVTAVVGLFL